METMTPAMITVSTTINAPVEKVWDYWNNPQHIMQWCQASPEWHAPYAENDLKEGGAFKTTMAARDGSMSFDFGGVYDKVETYERMEYTMSDGRRVEISFSQEDGGTKVVESFDPEGMNSHEMQQAGWQAILDNFKNYTETH